MCNQYQLLVLYALLLSTSEEYDDRTARLPLAAFIASMPYLDVSPATTPLGIARSISLTSSLLLDRQLAWGDVLRFIHVTPLLSPFRLYKLCLRKHLSTRLAELCMGLPGAIDS
ncbi:hypothetical protein C8Q74DRAFT_1234113 [Fomes fomentarius]|nr:hypothetical protein C8Q74DRAFT_1234113 [Fomes fomentarius]